MTEEHRKDEAAKHREHVTGHGHRTGIRAALGHHKDDEPLIARSVKNFLEAVKKPPSRTTWLVLIAILLAATLIGVWFYFTATATASSSTLWTKLDLTTGDEALKKFGDDPGQATSVQARFALARLARSDMQGVAKLGGPNAEREAGLKQIEEARAIYQKLTQEAGDAPALMQESLMGAAKANEALGDLAKAKQYYEQLARDFPNTALGKQAADRAKVLADEDTNKAIQTLADEFTSAK